MLLRESARAAAASSSRTSTRSSHPWLPSSRSCTAAHLLALEEKHGSGWKGKEDDFANLPTHSLFQNFWSAAFLQHRVCAMRFSDHWSLDFKRGSNLPFRTKRISVVKYIRSASIEHGLSKFASRLPTLPKSQTICTALQATQLAARTETFPYHGSQALIMQQTCRGSFSAVSKQILILGDLLKSTKCAHVWTSQKSNGQNFELCCKKSEFRIIINIAKRWRLWRVCKIMLIFPCYRKCTRLYVAEILAELCQNCGNFQMIAGG